MCRSRYHSSFNHVSVRPPWGTGGSNVNVNPETLSGELFELIENQQYREQVKAGLAEVRENLGAGDGARKMAQLVLSLLKNKGLKNNSEE